MPARLIISIRLITERGYPVLAVPTERIELKRELSREELAAVRQNVAAVLRGTFPELVVSAAGLNHEDPARCPRCGSPVEWWPTGIGSIPVCPNEPEKCPGVFFLRGVRP